MAAVGHRRVDCRLWACKVTRNAKSHRRQRWLLADATQNGIMMHCTSANIGAKRTLTWEFSGGEWRSLTEDPFPLGDDWQKAIEAAGYCGGSGEQGPVIVYEVERQTEITERWRFLVEIAPIDNHVFLVLLPNLPDLIQLLPALTALQQLSRVDELAEIAIAFFDKTFQVWHGHSLHGACHECDPSGCRQRQDMRVRAEIVKRQGVTT